MTPGTSTLALACLLAFLGIVLVWSKYLTGKDEKRRKQKEKLWNEYLEAKKSGDPARVADAASAIDSFK